MFRTPAKTKREEWNEYPTWEDIQTRVVEKAEAGRSGSPLEELLKERREKRRSLGIDRSPSPRPLPKYTTYAERKVRDKELDKEIARRRKEKGLPPLKSISVGPIGPQPPTEFAFQRASIDGVISVGKSGTWRTRVSGFANSYPIAAQEVSNDAGRRAEEISNNDLEDTSKIRRATGQKLEKLTSDETLKNHNSGNRSIRYQL
ncbi:hypothetical protein K1T71_014027 [Dendrolimus kikuchii]|uniref:Uncharacterized protein n=1 Tax=Dendrolimus kikuchii TaxID=765133 RepID=A0ACC1CET8_9NEOP|nr:hypothetical protein K1T71_014027 [Dendrolimus kikuchii]